MKILTSILIAIFLFSGCSKEKKEIKIEKKDIYTLKDIDGDTFKIELKDNKLYSKDSKKKILIIDFFATWCPPCKAEIPNLVDIQNRYKDKIKIVSILLEKDIDKNLLKNFKKEYNINYFISISKDNFEIAKKLYSLVQAPRNMPIPLIIIFKDGKYFMHYIGAVPLEMIESDIKNALGE